MNNEPVAWITMNGLSYQQTGLNDRPLYTHPAKETNYKFGVDWGKDNKSVTVVKIHDDGVAEIVFVDYQERTHPAKTLTDEEIIEIGNAVTNLIDSNEGWIEFARAILRKAQEK